MTPPTESPLLAIERELTADPTNTDAWLRRGELLYGQCHVAQTSWRLGVCGPEVFRNAFDQARYSFEQATRLAPEEPRGWVGIGSLLVDFENHPELDAEALVTFDRAVVLAPDDARVWYRRAGICVRRGDHAEAIRSLRHAIGLTPEYRDEARWEFPELAYVPAFRELLAESGTA